MIAVNSSKWSVGAGWIIFGLLATGGLLFK